MKETDPKPLSSVELTRLNVFESEMYAMSNMPLTTLESQVLEWLKTEIAAMKKRKKVEKSSK